MPSFTSAAAAAILAVAVNGAFELNGNWYGDAVDTIQYSNFAGSGSYNKVTNMDSNSGTCSSTPQAFSGSIAPLNGEMSIHARGPFALKQFAFYSPGSSSSKRSSSHHNHKRHGHAHFHAHDKEIREIHEAEQKRAVGDMVTATINGQVVTWVNEYDGGAAPTPAAAPAAANPGPLAAVGNAVASVANAVTAALPTSLPYTSSSQGDWVRSAYYDSESQTSEGVTFLNHFGGTGSGVFDYVFGNSLSYASADGTTGSSSSQILADTTLPSNSEVIIMTDKACTDSDPCDYSRPGTVAYHGFDGDSKIFLFEFSMPSDGTTGFNADMPALWSLNAAIPRTLQYGKAECSCWSTGCGEFDIMEVLDSGNTRCKSTLHAVTSGGDSNYINRPTGAAIKVALVMSDSHATVKVLGDDFDFSKTLTNSDFSSLASASSLVSNIAASLFTLG